MLGLSVRSVNSLKNSSVRTLADLVQYREEDLLKVKNVGEKALGEIAELLRREGLNFGMKIEEVDGELRVADPGAVPQAAADGRWGGRVMRHRAKGKQLSRTASHRKALLANMATSLFQHDRIETTEAKAKELRPYAERLITLARRGDLHARRMAERGSRTATSPNGCSRSSAPRFATRPGVHPHHQTGASRR